METVIRNCETYINGLNNLIANEKASANPDQDYIKELEEERQGWEMQLEEANGALGETEMCKNAIAHLEFLIATEQAKAEPSQELIDDLKFDLAGWEIRLKETA